MASGFDLNSVLSALGAAQGSTGGAMAGIQEASGLQKQAIQQESEAIGAAGEAAKTVKAQESAGLLLAQQESRRAATSMGTNMSDASQIVTQLGQTMRDQYAKIQAQQAKVNRINANATLSNPLGLLYDVIAGDEARAELKGAQDTFDIAAKTLQTLNQATQSTAATNRAIAETKSEASNAAELDILDAQTKQAQAQARQKLAGVDIQMFQMLDSMNARQASMAVQGYNLVAQEEQRQWSREMREQELELRKEGKQIAQSTLDLYNLGRAALGMPESDMASMKLESNINKRQVDFIISAGLSARDGTSNVRYGAAPADALTNVQAFRVNLPAAQTQLAKSLSMQVSQSMNAQGLVNAGLAKDLAAATMMLQDKKNLPNVQNAFLSKVAERDINSIDPRNEANLYSPPPLDSLRGKKELTDNPFLRDYLLPTVEAGGNIKWDPSATLKQGVDTMMSGKHSTAEIAEGISWIANQFMLINDTTKNYQGFGLPNMTTFGKFYSPISVDPGGYLNNINGTINLADPVQVTAMLQRIAAAVPGRTFSDRLSKLISDSNTQGVGAAINRALDRNRIENLMADPSLRPTPR